MPTGIAVDRRPAADHRRAVAALELLEPRPVDDAGDDVADVDRLAQVAAHEAEQLLGVVDRRLGIGESAAGPGLAPVEVRHDLAAHADGVHLVVGEVVAEPGPLGVHRGAAERLVVAVLARRHLHERRPGEEDLRLFLHDDDVVGQARAGRRRRRSTSRTPRTPSGCRASTARSGRRSTGRSRRSARSGRAAGLRVAGLDPEVGAGRLDEADVRDAVVAGDLDGARPTS